MKGALGLHSVGHRVASAKATFGVRQRKTSVYVAMLQNPFSYYDTPGFEGPKQPRWQQAAAGRGYGRVDGAISLF